MTTNHTNAGLGTPLMITVIAVAVLGAGAILYTTKQSLRAEMRSYDENVAVMEEKVRQMKEERAGAGSETMGGGMMKPTVKEFTITGKKFAFNLTELRVKKGDTMTINFESVDGLHDWVVDEFSARTAQVSTGGKTSVTFVADKVGTFEYYCSVMKHRAMGMVGKLIVE